MFDETRILFLYACSPVHMGAGVSLGPIDLPIQRERTTRYPMMQGSGLKGALRHAMSQPGAGGPGAEGGTVSVLFGPSSDNGERPSDHAGAVSFGDGRLVLFPVRSLFGTFAYVTSRLALGRLRRDLEWAGFHPTWAVPEVVPEVALRTSKSTLFRKNGKAGVEQIVLEEFGYRSAPDSQLDQIGAELASLAAGRTPELSFFNEKLSRDIVLLGDEDFCHFVNHATQIEPHVRIDEATGTAKDGAFFYQEHLPADAVLYSVVACASARTRNKLPDPTLGSAAGVAAQLGAFLGGEAGRSIQVGGDGSTGRGLFWARLSGKEVSR